MVYGCFSDIIMKKCMMLFWLLILQSGLAKGQGNAAGAECASLGGISSVLENPWSAVGNPAGLAGFSHLTLNTCLEQRYLVTEIGNYSLALTCPVRNGTMGICASYEGYQAFSTNRFTLAYGKTFARTVSAGMSLVYCLQSAGYESPVVHQASFSLGTLVKLSGRLSLAFTAFNPFQAYFKSHPNVSMQSIYRLGMAYHPSPFLKILAEIEKDLDYRPVFKMGFEYSIREEFYLRAGMQLLPLSYSLGAGFLVRKILIGLATTYHQYLGFTPVTSLQYLIK
jgi:hypothetical protein